MAENEDGQEKTEEPTARKREKAREEGKVITSKEMFVFATLAMGTILIGLLQNSLSSVSSIWASYLNFPSGTDLDSFMLVQLGNAWRHFLTAALIVAIPIGVVVLLLQAGIGGIQFAPKALGFKPDKINPIAGFKRMFSKQSVVELVKSVLKVAFLASVAFGLLYGMLPRIDKLWASDAGSAIIVIMQDMTLLLGGMTIVLAVIGALDLAWQMYTMRESLMMTLKEVKDESKETNGNPEVKGKIRQKQMEMSRRGNRERAALKDVPTATTIVTNPTHFAVALRYVPGEMSAPVVVASGKGHMAHEIIRLAASAGIQNVRIPVLARALYFTTQIGMEIDERLFTAVATLLGYVYHLDRGGFADDVPDVDLPEELRFNEFGRPMKGDDE